MQFSKHVDVLFYILHDNQLYNFSVLEKCEQPEHGFDNDIDT